MKYKEVIPKKWGIEYVVVDEPEYVFKILEINKGKSTSLHYHPKKIETLLVHKGNVIIFSDKETWSKILNEGEQFKINRDFKHKIQANDDSIIYEVSTQPKHDSIRISRAKILYNKD